MKLVKDALLIALGMNELAERAIDRTTCMIFGHKVWDKKERLGYDGIIMAQSFYISEDGSQIKSLNLCIETCYRCKAVYMADGSKIKSPIPVKTMSGGESSPPTVNGEEVVEVAEELAPVEGAFPGTNFNYYNLPKKKEEKT